MRRLALPQKFVDEVVGAGQKRPVDVMGKNAGGAMPALTL
jgi:hypothetical protein